MRRSTIFGALALLAVASALTLASTLASRSADDSKGVLASLLSRVLSTPTTRVSIGQIDGALSSNATIHNITIADRDGVWLKLDTARIVWSRTALLLHQRLEVDKLEAGDLQILRRPLPSEQAVAGSDQPILPQVPVSVQIKAFALKQLTLGAPVVEQAAQLSASGSASLGSPSEGLNLQFEAHRLDAPGNATAQLALVPKTQSLTLKLTANEPAGGLVVHALKVPNLPPLSLNLDGSGTLDAFAAQLTFDAGKNIGATGSAHVRRVADTRQLTLDLKARIARLLPAPAAPVFAGTTSLNGTIDFADSGAIAIKPLIVASQTAHLTVQGTLSAEQVADLTISAKALDNAGGKTAAGNIAFGKLAFDASVKGPILRPRVDAHLDATDVDARQGKLKTLTARFATTPAADAIKSAPIPFTAHAQATGVAPSDPALARALGTTLTLNAAGTANNGVADVENAHLTTPTADIAFTGRIGEPELHGRLTVHADDLTRFGDLAGLKLAGVLDLSASLSGVPKDGHIEAGLDGRADRFATGIAAIDSLAGGRLTLNGNIRKLPHGGYGFGNLRLVGRYASARADGEATADGAGINVQLTIPELKYADKRLTGRAEGKLRLTGSVTKPDADIDITVTDGSALGRPIPRLTLQATATDLTGQLAAKAKLAGSVGGKQAEGTLDLAKQAQGGWHLSDLALRVGSVSAKGALTLRSNDLASGRLAINAQDLDDISPLVLTKLSGTLRADTTLAVTDGGQSATLSAQAHTIKIGAWRLDRLDADMRVSDLYRRPIIDGHISVDHAHFGGEDISQIRLNAKAAGNDSAITLTARARGFAIDARGKLHASSPVRLDLASFDARHGKHHVALAHPITLTFRDSGVEAKSLLLALDRGRLAIDGRLGETLDVSLRAQSVPLSVSETVMPKLGISGTLNGDAKLTGTAKAPTGTWRLRIDRLVTPQTHANGLPPIAIAASGRLANHRTSLDATIRAAGAGTLTAKGTVPLAGDALDLTLRGPIDLGAVNQTLSASGRQLTGKARIDMRLRGSLARPKVDGTATISDGGYQDASLGVRLRHINGRLSAHRDTIRIDRLTAQTWDSGTISAEGSVRVAPDAGFPGNIRIISRNAKLVANDVVTAVANLSLTLSGPLTRDPKIGGRVDIVSMDISIPERLPTTLQPLAGTRHVDAPPEAAARLAMEAKAKARAGRKPAFDAALDLAVSAPNHLFVHGRGIDAELGGHLRLRGRLSNPVTVGGFELRHGRMSVAGTRLDFTQGRISFAGSLTPQLDLVAQTQTTDITATITISGPADAPRFAFTSSPALPPDEILSRLLFDKASGGLSPAQALQVAQVAAQFSGGGSDVFERVRRALGVSSIDVSVGSSGDPQVGLSRAINRRISVGVKAGRRPEDSGVSVDIDVTRHIRAQGEVDRKGQTAVGVGVQWEY
ncbi:MAG: translocation/assembly module TamB domain-containing protein [Pseudolabrys sp.]